MRYISHRGNLTGPTPEHENYPEYILKALQKGFEVEIDLWCHGTDFFLGHDSCEYNVTKEFLIEFSTRLWIHCKNLQALQAVRHIVPVEHGLHFFWHEKDRYAITSHDWVISYPGCEACCPDAVCMLPEWNQHLEFIPDYLLEQGFTAVCSDYIENIKELNSSAI